MDRDRLDVILGEINNVTVGVIGDFCLDAYWMLDPKWDEVSVETNKRVNRVTTHRYSLGGASNVVANLADLGVGSVKAFAVMGNDVFGQELLRQMKAFGIDCSGIIVQEDGWDTTVFAKPHIGDEEQNRFDFGTGNRIVPQTEKALQEAVDAALDQLDALIINQQIPFGYHSQAMIDYLNAVAEKDSICPIIVDSRDKSERFKHAILKINAVEAAAVCGEMHDINHTVPLEDLKRYATSIHGSIGKPLVITRGERGMVVFDGSEFTEVPGIQVLKQTDPVGAGDTAVSAIAAVLGTGASIHEAAHVANFATCVTVQKLQQTGTASQDEVRAVGVDPDYVFRPELAEDMRRARYLPDCDIELIADDIPRGKIAHAVFDHDGTISTLREGWEKIMEPVMVQSILGDCYDKATEEQSHKVARQVSDYIDKSTGIQTILQMEALAEMVREFGFVPEPEILDAAGYKEIYNNALMELINKRIARIESEKLNVTDWTLKGAVEFLRALHKRGVKLYLASGTDEHDVKHEAEILGYADLFDDRIFGAIDDVTKYSKKMVIDRIIDEHSLSGPELVTFGDGLVELRETKKRDGIAVGIASDEVRRVGLNVEKRCRLVQAGADLIVPDFSQADRLFEYLFAAT